MIAEELKKLMDKGANLVVVDTQDERIYPVKHIRGAINFPWVPVIREPAQRIRERATPEESSSHRNR
jgi:3-mercaptopyruvate sulfurtransferase SseA